MEVEVVAGQVGEAARRRSCAPSTRPCTSACDETSIATARAPRSRIAASRRKRSEASGVVRSPLAARRSSPGEAVARACRCARTAARRVEHRGAELDDRRLAVRAGDADQRQLAVGMAVDRRGEVAEQRARLGRVEPGASPRRPPPGAARSASTATAPRSIAWPANRRAVELRPAPGDEEIARLDRARVVTNAEDLGVGPEVSGERRGPATSSESLIRRLRWRGRARRGVPGAGSGEPGGGSCRCDHAAAAQHRIARRSSAVAATAWRAVMPARSGSEPAGSGSRRRALPPRARRSRSRPPALGCCSGFSGDSVSASDGGAARPASARAARAPAGRSGRAAPARDRREDRRRHLAAVVDWPRGSSITTTADDRRMRASARSRRSWR